jgi:hypothetical protein
LFDVRADRNRTYFFRRCQVFIVVAAIDDLVSRRRVAELLTR